MFLGLILSKSFFAFSNSPCEILYFASNDQTLVVSDSIAKYYAINIKTGELLWSKRNSAPFNSQIKIYKDKFFVTDFDNVLKCFSIKDGKEFILHYQ
jgi:outer membrane protein assembly factor BamB